MTADQQDPAALRFGVNLHAADPDLGALARTIEDLGYDTIFVPDHLGRPAPFSTAVAAAAATERVRVGTYMLNAAFWNPALLAREVATADRLSGGRLTLGIGAGHMKSEFDRAGIAFEPFGRRMARLAEVIGELDGLLTTGDHAPEPVQRPRPPLLLGGTGDGLLRLAAEHADVFGLSGLRHRPGHSPGTFRLISAEETDERLAFFRDLAGTREVPVDLLVQAVEITDDRWSFARRWSAALDGELSPEQVLRTPFLLSGTVDEIAGQLAERRARYGFDGVTVQFPSYEALGQVITALR